MHRVIFDHTNTKPVLKVRNRTICALCGSGGPLRKSHIIPEFFYTELYDQLHRFRVITVDVSTPEAFKQKGIYEKLLCDACEQKFSRWEKYAKEAFADGIGIKIVRDGNLFHLSHLDYVKFRLFLLSLLWRMAVSALEIFSEVNLGEKHERILRAALRHEDPLQPLEYPCLICAVKIDGKFQRDWILPPVHARSEGRHCYCVVINGILFCFYVSSHSMPQKFIGACINKQNEMSIYFGEVRKIPFLAEYVSNLGDALRKRKSGDPGT